MATVNSPIDVLLEHLKQTRGFDFTGYKRTTLERRIEKRMQVLGIEGYDAYLDHLEVQPDEFAELFNTILINVTGFFRDRATWDLLRSDVVPKLLADIGPDAPIRVWCAGCASGEETYSLAIVLADALGVDDLLARVKIYATDVDDEALAEARAARYPAKALEDVPEDLREAWFERVDQRWTVRKDLRRVVIFGRNDLVQDAPISRIDLLTCRNTLMYFNAETQTRVLGRLHFALNDHGLLLLGRSEMLLAHGDRFTPLDLAARVFRKVPKATLRDRLSLVAHPPTQAESSGDLRLGTVADLALDGAPTAQVVVALDGTLSMVNAHARELFDLRLDDLGRPLKDLEVSYRPVDLRSALDRVFDDGQPVVEDGVRFGASGVERVLDVRVLPLHRSDEVVGASVTFDDVTDRRRLEDDLASSRLELETAYEELQSTVEELETTNEELQSTNEELETINEELQSTNEELETINEELQSTNEELETINVELRERSTELDDVNGFLETILGALGIAIVVVDRDVVVRVWNEHSSDLWGVRADEAQGQHLLNLDIGLPVEDLRTGLRQVLAAETARHEVELSALNRRGQSIEVRVSILPMGAANAGVTGAILLVEEHSPA